jgi:hypothetical protein
MSKWKAFAVFFTLLFFSSLRGTLYVYFSTAEESEVYRMVMLALAILVDFLLLFFAVRYWKKAFRTDKNRPD